MSTTLLANLDLLSKQLGDYWASTTTSAGLAGGTTGIDTALMSKANDWATEEMWDHIGSGTYDTEERKVSALANTTGTWTCLAHGGQIASGVTYRLHRLWPASDKKLALIAGCKDSWSNLFKPILDETRTAGNWLLNGDVETWTVATYPDNWRVSAVTATKTTTAPYYWRSATSCKLDTAAGYLYTDQTYNPDIIQLQGKAVTFKASIWCDTASCARLAVYDGTTTTYSDYHSGNSKWGDTSGDDIYVDVNLPEQISQLSLRVYHSVAAGTTYVDNIRLLGGTRNKIYIGDLGLANNEPHVISMWNTNQPYQEPWRILRRYSVDSGGYLRISDALSDYRLRIEGIGYLDFLASGVSSTAWTATVAIDSPQNEILVAQAALWLYRTMSLPNDSTGTTAEYRKGAEYWERELDRRKAKYSMLAPPATVKYG